MIFKPRYIIGEPRQMFTQSIRAFDHRQNPVAGNALGIILARQDHKRGARILIDNEAEHIEHCLGLADLRSGYNRYLFDKRIRERVHNTFKIRRSRSFPAARFGRRDRIKISIPVSPLADCYLFRALPCLFLLRRPDLSVLLFCDHALLPRIRL